MCHTGYITKDEWMFGMKELEYVSGKEKRGNQGGKLKLACRTDSIEKLRAKRSDFEKVFHDPEQFKEMYKYTFTYAKNRDQKCMEIEVIMSRAINLGCLPVTNQQQQQRPHLCFGQCY